MIPIASSFNSFVTWISKQVTDKPKLQRSSLKKVQQHCGTGKKEAENTW